MRTLKPVWLLFLCATAFAQPSRKDPIASPAGRAPARPLPPGLRARLASPREFSLAPLSRAEQSLLAEPSRLPRTGVHRSLPARTLANGSWDTAADGRRVWHVVVRSPGSTGIRVHFSEFSVGSGSVWLHDGMRAAGPYTDQGLFGNGRFWSDTVFSESVAIEYEPQDPAATSVPFAIDRISHQVAGPALAAAQPPPADAADTCHLDPNCYPDWQSSMSSVGQIIFEDEGFEALCSGALVATRDNSLKPYFMTAGHCISTEEAARSVETYWTYQTASCGGPAPDRANSTKSSAGAHLLTAAPLYGGDYSLLLLKDVPAGVVYAGWDPSAPPFAAPLTGIHHPKGSYKRISFGRRTGDAFVVIDNLQNPAQDYYQVLWDKGRTEPGSSGSPLFSGPGVIVGALTYGPVSPTLSACQISPSVDGYGRFSVAYPSMRDYLEDLPVALVLPKPANVQMKGLNGAVEGGPSQTVTLTTEAVNAVGFKARADAPWIQLSTDSGQVSANAPAALQVTVDPKYLATTGAYVSTVTITSGAADPQFINVRVDMSVQRSQVVLSFSPNPVPAQPPGIDGTRWTFQVRLDEQAGVGTRITSLKINGTDYSKSIVGFFGSSHLDAGGSLQAGLHASGAFAQGDQYFELTGLDDDSGQMWYKSATVQFTQ